jgi:hypothetical protein
MLSDTKVNLMRFFVTPKIGLSVRVIFKVWIVSTSFLCEQHSLIFRKQSHGESSRIRLTTPKLASSPSLKKFRNDQSSALPRLS